MLQTTQLRDNLYALDDGMVRQFLFLGEGEALLIDTGLPGDGVLAAVRALTDAPVRVLLTHGDPDHAGGVAEFGEVWLHEKDWPMVQGATLHPLREGDLFCCGDFRLEVIEIPGHTYGSVAFLERDKKLLFSGDSVQKGGPIYMFGAARNLALYIASQRKLMALTGAVETVFPSHHACPIDPSYIRKNLEDALAMQAGQLPSTPEAAMPCRTYRGRWTDFYCDDQVLHSRA